MQTTHVKLTLDIHKSLWWTSNKRGNHWAAYSRTRSVKTIAHIAGANLKNIRPQDYETITSWDKVHVTIVVHPRTGGRFDPANASPMGKAIVDALTLCGFWVDDDSTHVVGPDYRAGDRSKRDGYYQLEIIMEEAQS